MKTIVWTVLANGIKEDKLQLSILVSPRLSSKKESNLDYFIQTVGWPENWTEIIGQHSDMRLNINGNSYDAPIISSHHLSPKMWSELFPPETPVLGYKHQDYTQKNFRSFSVKETQNNLKSTYKEVAKISLGQLPKLTDFKRNPTLKRFLKLGTIPDTLQKIREECINEENHHTPCENDNYPTIDFNKPSSPNILEISRGDQTALHFFLTYRFYNRLEHSVENNRVKTVNDKIKEIEQNKLLKDTQKKELIAQIEQSALREEFSFERILANLSDYPIIMRKLGLIIDVEIPSGMVEEDDLTNLNITLDIKSQFISKDIDNLTPTTHTQLRNTPPSFYVLPNPQEPSHTKQREIDLGTTLSNGYTEFDLVQVDMDGANLKAIHTANSFNKIDLNHPNDEDAAVLYGTPDYATLPSLQSAGISLARYNRAFEVQKHLKKMHNKYEQQKPNQNTNLYAQDLIRGYRVDVQLEGEELWYSLCQREGVYQIREGKEFKYTDEGYVKTATLSTVDNNSFYLHENMFRWDGWSLCVERPGKLIYDEMDIKEGIRANSIDEKIKDKTPINVKFSVPTGSLPKLRFGQKYNFRIRVVDVAGNSQPLDSLTQSSLSTTYKRFEPVAPPSLTFLEEPSEGESLEHMVIRSTFDEKSKKSNKRHVFPAKTSQLMAETHGTFDEYMKASKYADAFNIASRDAHTLLDCDNCKSVPINKPTNGNENTDNENIFIVCSNDMTYTVPYLPDVYADGVALRHVPGVTFETEISKLEVVKDFNEVILKIPFSGVWPNIETFRIEIQEREGKMLPNSCQETFLDKGEPTWDSTNRVLTIYLPKAEMVTLQYSTYLNTESIENMGMSEWTEGVLHFKELAQCGMNWMVAPFRELRLIHAVQQPLCKPKFLELYEDKKKKAKGKTFAKLEGIIETNAKSTDKVEFLAQWKEINDDPKFDEPKVEVYQSSILQLPIQYSQNNLVAKKRENFFTKHEFGDTKFRLVSYKLNATSRFKEYYSPQITENAENITRKGDFYEGIKIRSEKELEKDYGAMIELETGEKQNVIPIYNSARPHAPKISYSIPTFGWEGPTWSNENGIINVRKKRTGRGFRVYLERPWFSSGEGEMLGVVLLSDCFEFDPEDLAPLDTFKSYVSQWGRDPIYAPKKNQLSGLFPKANKFELAKCFSREHSLKELPLDKRVDVVGHKVEYDKNKKLWFSDIVIDSSQAYNPFVRLALARYQPNSIDHAHLSPVVLSDFMQLLPDRELEVHFNTYKKDLEHYIHIDVSIDGAFQKTVLPRVNRFTVVVSKYILDKENIKNNPHMGWIIIKSIDFDHYTTKINFDIPKPNSSEIYKLDINEFEPFSQDQNSISITYVNTYSPRLVYNDSIIFKTDEPFEIDL